MSTRKIAINATQSSEKLKNQFLPESIVGEADLSRLKRELEGLDEAISQLGLQKSLRHANDMPRVSQMLSLFADSHDLSLRSKEDRQSLLKYINSLQKLPIVTIAFASSPSEVAVRKIVRWLRENIHPATLVAIEVRPSIIGGFTIRTANRLLDFSVGARLGDSLDSLSKHLREVVKQ